MSSRMLERTDDMDGFVLTTGTKIYANRRIIGISPTLDVIHYGYDGDITDIDESGTSDEFTKDELLEICDHMIELWTKMRMKIER